MEKKFLTDTEMINDVLATEKSLAKLYMDAIIESSCEKMRATLAKVHMEVLKNQFDCFKYMSDNGLYKIENAQKKTFDESVNKFAKPL